MTALLLLASVPIVMWIFQSVQLKYYGLPLRWRIDAGDAPRAVRTGGRIVTQLSLLGVILAFPVLKGAEAGAYYGALLPRTTEVLRGVQGAVLSVLFLCILFVAWIVTDRVRVDLHQSRRKWTRRLLLLVPTALLGAFVEELIFRGIFMADLMATGVLPGWLVLMLSTIVFAGAHYVRSVKRRWTAFGHLGLGLLLCVAFQRTGDLWLPVGLHAGGIAMIMGTRPFFRYDGPAWLTGASIFPFAGATGIVGLAFLTLFIAQYYGVP